MPISFGEILKQATPKNDDKKPGEIKRPLPAQPAAMPSPVPSPVPPPFPSAVKQAQPAAVAPASAIAGQGQPAQAAPQAPVQAQAAQAPVQAQAAAPQSPVMPQAPAQPEVIIKRAPTTETISSLNLEIELKRHLGQQIRVYTCDKENVGGKLDLVADGWIKITNARSATSEYYSDEDIINIRNITRVRYSRSITKAEYVEEMNLKNGEK